MKNRLLVLGIVLISGFLARTAGAAPILGAQLTYTGGTVTVESLPVTSGFVSELALYDSSFSELLFLMNDEPPGVTVTFDPSTLGVTPGSELIFGIKITVPPTLTKFFMGPASRNPDGIIHAAVDNLGGGVFVVGFEDITGGGDLDYDDNKFKFTGGINSTVAEPTTVGLLALGLGVLARRRFRRTR